MYLWSRGEGEHRAEGKNSFEVQSGFWTITRPVVDKGTQSRKKLGNIFLATSHEVVRRFYTSSDVTVSLLAKFDPIFWYKRPLYDKNWRF